MVGKVAAPPSAQHVQKGWWPSQPAGEFARKGGTAKQSRQPAGATSGKGGSFIRPAAALLAAALLAGGCASESKLFLLHPKPPTAKEYTLAAGALLYKDGKAEAELRPLDPKMVNERLSAAGRANPFLIPGEDPPLLIIFELRLKAAGKRPLYFNPSQTRGLDDDKNRYYPLGFAEFYQIHSEEPEREERLKTFKVLCYDGQVQLKPGEEVTRYLPISAAESAPQNLAITLPLLYDGKEGIYPSFIFEGFPVEEEKKP